jgi:aldose 1-epimerase
MNIDGKTYGTTKSGDRIDRVTVSNSHGVSFSVISYGATLISVKAPDKNGNSSEITLGKADLAAYEAGHPFFGSTVGRVCNRIANGKFNHVGHDYSLPVNDGPNCLHGGSSGFDKALWDIFPFKKERKAGVKFSYISEDGEEGFPGMLEVTATFTLTEDSELFLDYEAITNKETPVNLTNHVYWNLEDPESADVLDHKLMMNCDKYLPVNDVQIPTGELKDVAGTPFDFRKEQKIGAEVKAAGGYDHCYITSQYKKNADAVQTSEDLFPVSKNIPFAVLTEEISGRKLEFFTSLPGAQLYSGNFLENETGRTGSYYKHSGVCLETQNFPDAVNQPNFPSPILKPGEKYRSQSMIRFSTLK